MRKLKYFKHLFNIGIWEVERNVTCYYKILLRYQKPNLGISLIHYSI